MSTLAGSQSTAATQDFTHNYCNLYILLTVHLSIILRNDQPDTQFRYSTIGLLLSSKCFEHYMLIIRRLNCIDAASNIVTLSKWPSGAPDGHLQTDDNRCCINTIQPPDDGYIMLETCRRS